MKRKILAAVLCMGVLLATPVKPLANINGFFSVAYAQETAQSFKSVSELQSALNALPEGGKLLVEDTSLYFSGSESVTVPSGVTLVLGNDVVFDGLNTNQKPFIIVYGTLEITQNTILKNNNESAIRIENTGYVNMNGGTISYNKAQNGGGVYVKSGTFTLNGGEISHNQAYISGGGIYVSGNCYIYEHAI